MGRPLTGKKHVGIRRDTRPNGDVYVYERVTGYDAKTQKTKTISTRLLGKILAGTTEMIPTRPKNRVLRLWSLRLKLCARMSDYRKFSNGPERNRASMKI